MKVALSDLTSIRDSRCCSTSGTLRDEQQGLSPEFSSTKVHLAVYHDSIVSEMPSINKAEMRHLRARVFRFTALSRLSSLAANQLTRLARFDLSREGRSCIVPHLAIFLVFTFISRAIRFQTLHDERNTAKPSVLRSRKQTITGAGRSHISHTSHLPHNFPIILRFYQGLPAFADRRGANTHQALRKQRAGRICRL